MWLYRLHGNVLLLFVACGAQNMKISVQKLAKYNVDIQKNECLQDSLTLWFGPDIHHYVCRDEYKDGDRLYIKLKCYIYYTSENVYVCHARDASR
jgi:hypothetical protein